MVDTDIARSSCARCPPASSRQLPSPIATARFLYTANRISNDISVLDLASGKEIKRLAAGRGASYLTLSPDGTQIYCTHIYPNIGDVPHAAGIGDHHHRRGTPDGRRAQASAQRRRSLSYRVFRDGRLGIAASFSRRTWFRSRTWSMDGPLAIRSPSSAKMSAKPSQVPIDELDRYFALPFGVAIAPDKSAAISRPAAARHRHRHRHRRAARLHRARRERRTLANDLSASANYVVARIPVGHDPKGIAALAGRQDALRRQPSRRHDLVIDTAAQSVSRIHRTRRPADISAERRGEQSFLQRAVRLPGAVRLRQLPYRFHLRRPDWDLEPDGFGNDIVDNRLLEDVSGTEPFKWNGGNPEPADRMRPAHREILLPLGELRRAGTRRPVPSSIDSAAAESIPLAERRTDAGAGARQSHLRAHVARTASRFRKQSVRLLPLADRTTRTSRWSTWAPESRPTARR